MALSLCMIFPGIGIACVHHNPFWPFRGGEGKSRASGMLGKHSTNRTTSLACLPGKIPASQTGLELVL